MIVKQNLEIVKNEGTQFPRKGSRLFGHSLRLNQGMEHTLCLYLNDSLSRVSLFFRQTGARREIDEIANYTTTTRRRKRQEKVALTME